MLPAPLLNAVQVTGLSGTGKTASVRRLLQQALADALKRNDSLAGELRVTHTERDLLNEQLNKFKCQLFAASSEVTSQHQKNMFFNEAERLGAHADPAAEEVAADKIDVPGHKRANRGRKPLDPALPRDVVRHELTEDERVCPHDGAALREVGVDVSEQLTSSRSRYA